MKVLITINSNTNEEKFVVNLHVCIDGSFFLQ